MKLLIFLLIVTVCGSLSKRPVLEPCGTKVEIINYLNGRKIHKHIESQQIEWTNYPVNTICHKHKKPMHFNSDSVTYKVKLLF